MQYLLMVHIDEAEQARTAEAEASALTAEYVAFAKSTMESGHYRAGERLRPTMDAKTVRVREGKTLVTDGPFAETREQLGGYFLIEAKDAGEAVAIAARIPGARHGSVEVRPIWPVHDH